MTLFIAPPDAPAYVNRARDALKDEDDDWVVTHPSSPPAPAFTVYLRPTDTPKVFEAHIYESNPLDRCLPLYITTCGILGETTHDTFVAEVRRVLSNLSIVRSLDALLLPPSIPHASSSPVPTEARFPQGSKMYVRHKIQGIKDYKRGHVLRLGNAPADVVVTEASDGPDGEEVKCPPSNLYVAFKAPNESWFVTDWNHGTDATKPIARAIPDFASLPKIHGSFELPYLPRVHVIAFTASLKLPSMEGLGPSTLDALSPAQKSSIQTIWMRDHFDCISADFQQMRYLVRFAIAPPPANLFQDILGQLSMFVGAFASSLDATQKKENIQVILEGAAGEGSKGEGGGAGGKKGKGKGKKGRR